MRRRSIGLSLVIAGIVAVACSGSNESGSSSTDLAASARGGDSSVRIIQVVSRRDIVSNRAGAEARDEQLQNAWGLAFSSFGTAWVSAAETGVSGVYDEDGKQVIPDVIIPPPSGGSPPGHPTGQVFNANVDAFSGDAFIFVTEDGVVAGWQPGGGDKPSTRAVVRVDNSKDEAIYKGLAIASGASGPRLYAANFSHARIDVFDSAYARVDASKMFVDDQLPAGYAPFNVQAIGDRIFVTYAKQDDQKEDEVAGAGNGFVDVYDGDGMLVSRLIQGGALNAPWGIALAPASYGAAANRLLVGNFGDGRINVYALSSNQARFEGVLGGKDGKPLVIDGLWALQFGNDKGGFASGDLYFTAGPNEETDGVFGELDVEEAEPTDAGTSDAGVSDASTTDSGNVSDAAVSDGGGTKTW